MAWGRNDQGQLGRGTQTTKGCRCEPEPARVRGLSDVTAIAASGGTAAALKEDGSLWTWGNKSLGQLGGGQAGDKNQPTAAEVEDLAQIEAVEAGGGFLLARGPAASSSAGESTTTPSWGSGRRTRPSRAPLSRSRRRRTRTPHYPSPARCCGSWPEAPRRSCCSGDTRRPPPRPCRAGGGLPGLARRGRGRHAAPHAPPPGERRDAEHEGPRLARIRRAGPAAQEDGPVQRPL